jgi:spore germination cell wall hydrolase CwlJ-like protein
MAIFYEARSEPYLGQQAVAYVILNRADWKQHRVCLETFKPYQFSPFNDVVPIPDDNNKAWIRSQRIAKQVLRFGKLGDITNGATYFYNPALANPSWALVCEPRLTIMNHHFCSIN